jgi:hypothetical protein
MNYKKLWKADAVYRFSRSTPRRLSSPMQTPTSSDIARFASARSRLKRNPTSNILSFSWLRGLGAFKYPSVHYERRYGSWSNGRIGHPLFCGYYNWSDISDIPLRNILLRIYQHGRIGRPLFCGLIYPELMMMPVLYGRIDQITSSSGSLQYLLHFCSL